MFPENVTAKTSLALGPQIPAISPLGPLMGAARVGVHFWMSCTPVFGGATVIATDWLFDASACDLAVIIAVPSATPVTTALLPFERTPTMFGFDEDHVTAWDAPFVTWTVAVSVEFSPTPITNLPEIPTDRTVGALFPQLGELTAQPLSLPPHAA